MMLRTVKTLRSVSECAVKQALLAQMPKHGCDLLSIAARPLTSWCISHHQEPKGQQSCAVQAARHYAQPSRRKKAPPSQLDDLPAAMLKKDYADVPLACSSDDLVKRLLSLELGCHKDKLRLKEEQLVARVRRDDHDRSSAEVKVALLTARIRNYQEHLQKHPKDKANKRRMLMAIDKRKKHLKYLRRTRNEAFEFVCQQLDITYKLPPLYYRTLTRRWRAKKEFCLKVFEVVQRRKAKKREAVRKAASAASGEEEAANQAPTEAQEPAH